MALPPGFAKIVQAELDRLGREQGLVSSRSPEGQLTLTGAGGARVSQSLEVLPEACRDALPEGFPERVRHLLQGLASVAEGASDGEAIMKD